MSTVPGREEAPVIVDAHVHAWDRWPYDAAVPDPATRGSAAALLHEMDAAGVERALVVCAAIGGEDPRTANPANNADVARAVAAHPDRLTALVDVDSRWSGTYHRPGAADRLERVLAETGASGVSHYLADEVDGWFEEPEGRAFLARAAAAGVPLSLHARPAWFAALGRALRAVPGLVVLLHHQGHVVPGSPTFERDLVALTDLAAVPGVAVKVSGFHYLADRPWAYPYPETHAVLHALLAAFGTHRLLWGSDFPVSRPHVTYRQSLELVRELTGGDADVLGGTALRLVEPARRPIIPARPDNG
ncbi:amidohydrolase family protein [Georgenia sp. M64]|uniref:amidohydrolase family protein n=1 Tax=Georgenia sp. M64 TaxID=3120520 RepID=UPI0030DE1F04